LMTQRWAQYIEYYNNIGLGNTLHNTTISVR
jgi:hypothetical protein